MSPQKVDWMWCYENPKEAAAEIDKLRVIEGPLEMWRRAFHHGTREEVDLQERYLLAAIEAAFGSL